MRPRLRRSPAGRLAGLIAAFGLVFAACGGDDEAVAVGNSAPDFALSNSSGASVALEAYQNQDVLLYFHMADG